MKKAFGIIPLLVAFSGLAQYRQYFPYPYPYNLPEGVCVNGNLDQVQKNAHVVYIYNTTIQQLNQWDAELRQHFLELNRYRHRAGKYAWISKDARRGEDTIFSMQLKIYSNVRGRVTGYRPNISIYIKRLAEIYYGTNNSDGSIKDIGINRANTCGLAHSLFFAINQQANFSLERTEDAIYEVRYFLEEVRKASR